MGVGLRITSGPVLVRAGDLAALLTDLQEGDVLFIDEIHRLHRSVEEILYPAMEDFKLDILIGKGPTARSIRLDLPRFTLVGATTRTGLVAGPLRDRFGFVGRLDHYDVGRTAGHRAPVGRHPRRAHRRRRGPPDRRALAGNAAHRQPAAAPGAGLRRGAGRRTHHLGRPRWPGSRCSASTSSAWTRSTGRSSTSSAAGSPGGPVGLTTLAQCIGEEPDTIEDAYEPYLLQQGLIQRTSRGRVAAPRAWAHLGLTPVEPTLL